jgi:hypothetical protein
VSPFLREPRIHTPTVFEEDTTMTTLDLKNYPLRLRIQDAILVLAPFVLTIIGQLLLE